MPLLTPPLVLADIMSRPGVDWNDDERWQVMTWLMSPVEEGRLLRIVMLQLSSESRHATAIDAEEVWTTFCLTRLPKLTRDYNHPSRGPFVPLLLLALRQACSRDRIRRRSQDERLRLATAGEPDPVLGGIHQVSPERALSDDQEQRRVRRCVDALPPNHRALVVRHYFRLEPLKGVASDLGITENLAKVTLFRARQKLRTCLSPGSCNQESNR